MTRGRQWMELALGLLLGLSLGLTIAWWVAPNAHIDLSPAALRADYKDQYRLLVASAYRVTGDLGRAQTRLTLLQDMDMVQALIDQALRLRSGQAQSVLFLETPEQSVYAIALLANSIQQTDEIQESDPTPTTSPLSILSTATFLPFELVSQETICDSTHPGSRAKIQVHDASGHPLAGVEILVTWEDGQQRFFTGLKPELGYGYADFVMTPGIQYTLQLMPSSLAITGLVAPECPSEDGTVYQGGLLLVFEQP
jgi:hypothetical protein